MQQKTLQFAKNPTAMQIEEQPKQSTHLIPWVEKFRPNKIDELSHQEEVIRSLNGVLKTGSLPHLLLHGPPGTGKTSAIIAMAKQLFGPDFWRERVLELNASDDRGINVVRNKVKKFAEQMTKKNPNNEYLCPNYKIIILDEADSMTQEAQGALRRIIEDYSTNTRFCIICNYITKIIEPLASRCVKYRFKSIPQIQQLERLQYISDLEGISIDDKSLIALFQVSGGDLRKSINMLQSASTLYNKVITQQTINEISGVIPDETVDDLVSIVQTTSLSQVKNMCDDVIREGYNIEQLLIQYSNKILACEFINEGQKALIMEKAAFCEKCLIEGASETLQLFNLMAQSQAIIHSF